MAVAGKNSLYIFYENLLNPFQNKPWFLRVCSNEQFSFSISIFYCFENFPPFSSNLKLSSANFFSLEESKICRLGKG